ncbi:MAG: response regulator [Pseudomonadota bacterium]|jgi:two-component system OmpR family response regulator
MSASPEHVLIVDDDREIRSLLSQYLEQAGYRVTTVADGRAMLQALEHLRIDLVVLDLMLPGSDGLTLCRNLRARSQRLPILILTARGDAVDRILGLEMGADDYLPKPFNPRELLARIKTILRRSQALPPNLEPQPVQSYTFGPGWRLSTATLALTAPDGQIVPLSGAEFRLLRAFLQHPQRVLSRDQLLEWVSKREALAYDRSIDVQVARLRKRLRDDGSEPALIRTLRGQGYLLACEVQCDT